MGTPVISLKLLKMLKLVFVRTITLRNDEIVSLAFLDLSVFYKTSRKSYGNYKVFRKAGK